MTKTSDRGEERTSDDSRLRKHLEDVRARQRNTVWPDTLKNSREVDAVLWNGTRASPVIHRIGMSIFGLAYLLSGITLAITLVEKRQYVLLVLVAIFWAVAAKLLWNVVRKHK